MAKKVYLIENLDCANCAAKVERKINQLPGVQEATITFATRQLRITAEDPDRLLPAILEAAEAVEPGVVITERERRGSHHRHHHHEHGESCGCGHDHSHEEGHHHHEHGESCGCGHDHSHGGGHHHHEHGESCGCGHDHSHGQDQENKAVIGQARTGRKASENQKTLLGILTGAAFFALGLLLEHQGLALPSLLSFVAGYGILGGRIVLTACKNLVKGHVFDENFLMSVATLGAFAIREWPEAVGVMLFYRVGEFFEHIAVEKSRSQIMEAVDLRPEVVQLVIGEQIRTIPAEEANIGDILLVRAGDRIPLDGVVVDGTSRIDTSPITGEPVPVKAEPGDSVISGCVNESGVLKIRVEKVLEESMVTRILDSVENAAASKPKMDRFITRFARIYTPVVVLLAVGTAVIPSLFTGDWNYWVYTALSFLVMSCPCALVLSVPLAFFSGIGAGSKRGILFKGGLSLEAMTQVQAVVMDKTGTITEGNFLVQSLSPVGVTEETLLTLAAGCELSSTHPIGASILAAAEERGLTVPHPETVEELAGHGIRAVFPEGEVLCGNQKLMQAKGISLGAYQEESHGTEVLLAQNGRFIGAIHISDTLKKDAKAAMAALRELGVTTAMLTGDREESAKAVAAETGIDEVHARLLPEEKLERLQEIRSRRGGVMFVGDGINDAPVLAGADVGAAMGSGADAAIEAADVVFMTSSVEAIPQSLTIARSTSQIAWQNVVFALVIKVAVMVLGLLGYASMWLAVFADTGVAMLCVLNSIRVLYRK